MNKKYVVKYAIIIVLILIIGMFALLAGFYISGERNFTKTKGKMSEQEFVLKKNQRIYEEEIYQYNEDIINILVMGIDKETFTTVGGQSWDAEEGSVYAGGQADALFLGVIDRKNEEVSIININRNAMVDVDIWDAEGNYQGIATKQIALQHGFGDGKEQSCERQAKAVSRMLGDIPIDLYVSISMDAIPELNDAVGGIEVEVLDDIIYPEYDMDLHQGDRVLLQGEKAYWYLRLRNENVFNSNELRLQRQKQYLKEYIEQVKGQTKKDLSVPIQLYNIVQKYMVTNVDVNSFTYLVAELLDYEIKLDSMYGIAGEVVQGNNFEEYYIDDEALEKMIIDLFFEKTNDK